MGRFRPGTWVTSKLADEELDAETYKLDSITSSVDRWFLSDQYPIGLTSIPPALFRAARLAYGIYKQPEDN